MKSCDRVRLIPKSVEDLNDEETELLEDRMRPGGYPASYSTSGFLGPGESLRAVARADLRELQGIEVSPEQLGEALERLAQEGHKAGWAGWLQRVGVNPEPWRETIDRWVEEHDMEAHVRILEEIKTRRSTLLARKSDEDGDRRVQIGDFRIGFESYDGYQMCPFGPDRVYGGVEPCGRTDTVVFAERVDSGEKLVFSGLLPHLIKAHHFFEGRDVPDRLDPVQAARFFRLGCFAKTASL